MCYEESFPDGIPEDDDLFERQKRDFVTRFKALAQKTTSHAELISLVMSSYDLFVGEVDLRSMNTKKQKVVEDEDVHMPYFNIKKEDWVVYLVISLLSLMAKWCDDRFAAYFSKKHGMDRHVFMKVIYSFKHSTHIYIFFNYWLTFQFN